MHLGSNTQEKINEIYISFEKLETLVSVLGKTLVEDFDFENKTMRINKSYQSKYVLYSWRRS